MARGGTSIQFLGATGTVTGSRFLVDAPAARVLVDCGLYQGVKELRERNWDAFPVDPGSLDAVVLTHAHIDHSGYLPALVREGFAGRIYATRRTVELCGIVLPDAARLQEEDAAYANRRGFSKHSPALPLYTEKDANAALSQLSPVAWNQAVEVAEGVRASFRPAGHILGSAVVTLETADCAIGFSGDLGRGNHPLLLPPAPPPAVRALLVESTYGDREHDEVRGAPALARAIERAVDRGGVILIPAFAVDRTEVVLFHLKRLMESGAVPEIPVYADSPMALDALGVYRGAVADGDAEIRPELRGRPSPFDPGPGQLVEARDTEASKAIHEVRGPAIILSASGMATGGRVLHHLLRRLPDPRNSVFLVGYQAERTRGRLLLEGAHLIKMLGRYVAVRAEIVDLTGLSVHSDRRETLGWLASAPARPDLTFVVHGEPAASRALCDAVERRLSWDVVVPQYRERVRVD
jgi:metallo-beta-lactamase family protein